MTNATDSASVVEVRGLTVVRRGLEVLRDVDWSVSRGDHCVLFGANGSGKTTLLSCLMTYVPATRGSVSVLGHVHGKSDWRELRKLVGVVSDSVARMIPQAESAFDIVYGGYDAMLGSWGKKQDERLQGAAEMMSRIDCEAISERPFAVLSQGERQRVLIGRALVSRPPLLVLDEPCSGLDAAARERFLAFINTLGDDTDGPTIVLVTHHVEEIAPLFNRVLILKQGRVLASGLKSEILTSARVSEALGAELTLRLTGERYSLTLDSSPSRIL